MCLCKAGYHARKIKPILTRWSNDCGVRSQLIGPHTMTIPHSMVTVPMPLQLYAEGFQTAASAHVLRQPTIAGPSISIVSVHKFGT